MAKGNMLLGYATGSVGDLTFKRVKGQQVQVPRVRNPHNPRSAKQSIQRGRFAAAVKFFTRGITNFYKYAFENKRQVESDYNAFMRENIKRAPAISREAFANYNYPIFAPFIMAKGTLQPLTNSIADGKVSIDLGVAAPTALPTTVGALSAILVGTEAYNVGDILTLVTISSSYNGIYPSVDANGSGKPSWVIRQIILNTTAENTLVEALGVQAVNVNDSLILTDANDTTLLPGTLNAFVAVHSRNTSEGLKASTQELILSEAAATAYEASFADAYKAEVILSWQRDGEVDAAPDAILQGSIAYNDYRSKAITDFVGSVLSATGIDLEYPGVFEYDYEMDTANKWKVALRLTPAVGATLDPLLVQFSDNFVNAGFRAVADGQNINVEVQITSGYSGTFTKTIAYNGLAIGTLNVNTAE